MASNVIIAPSNATYHTDSGTHSISNTSDSYTSATREALSKYGSIPSLSGGNSSINSFVSDVLSKSGSSIGDAMRQAMQIASGNSALSQSYAREMMDYQTDSDRYAMNWSAQEAKKTRDWQEQMSNTAHQREVDDLVKAGLNPILSVNGGSSTPSGATGNAYTSSGAMGTVDNNVTALMASAINSATQLKGIEMQLENADRIAHLNSETSILNNQISSAAGVQAAGISAAAARYGYELNADNVAKQLENQFAIANLPGNLVKTLEYLFPGKTAGAGNKALQNWENLLGIFKNPDARGISVAGSLFGGSGRSIFDAITK